MQEQVVPVVAQKQAASNTVNIQDELNSDVDFSEESADSLSQANETPCLDKSIFAQLKYSVPGQKKEPIWKKNYANEKTRKLVAKTH